MKAKMETSLFSQSLYALPLMEAIEATARIGFPAIELACGGPHFGTKIAIENPESVAEHVRKTGLEVSALSLFNNFTDATRLDAQVEEARMYIGLASLFGTDILKMTPGPPASADALKEHWRCFEVALKQLIPVAEEAGVRLAFETHMRQLTDTLAGFERLLDIAESDVVGLTVDFSNLMFAGEDMPEVFATLRGRMYNTHLKNGTIGDDGSWNFDRLDTGLTDYSQVFPLLRDMDYDGYLTIECLGSDASKKPFETARRDLEILERYLEQMG
jgi:sugar phosphate isomerase/epimerase